MRSEAATIEQYLEELSDDRREAISAVRDTIVENLPDGYEETMNWGMITYAVPLETYPDTYNGQPLLMVALASQKNYMSLYLMAVYADDDRTKDFVKRYKATGKRLDMGKSCVRFRKLGDLPLDLIAETVGAVDVDGFIRAYERSRS